MAAEPNGAGVTTAQLKHDIDTGRTGDKAGGFDPAAAPLGTDDEAGGAPHDKALNARTRAEASAPKPSGAKENAASPELAPNAQRKPSPYILPAVIGAAAGLAAGVLLAVL